MGVPSNHPKSDDFSIETHGGLGIFGGINIHLPAILWYLGCTVLTHNRFPCIGMAMMTERRVPAAKKVKKSAPRSPAAPQPRSPHQGRAPAVARKSLETSFQGPLTSLS